jgi:hypothetical protein
MLQLQALRNKVGPAVDLAMDLHGRASPAIARALVLAPYHQMESGANLLWNTLPFELEYRVVAQFRTARVEPPLLGSRSQSSRRTIRCSLKNRSLATTWYDVQRVSFTAVPLVHVVCLQQVSSYRLQEVDDAMASCRNHC